MKNILRISLDLCKIISTNFPQRFSQRFSRCQFWHPIYFSRLWKTRPPGSRAAREDHCSGEPRTVARDSRAACASSQCINNHQKSKKILIFSTIIFWGTRGHEARVGGGGVCCLMATLRNANGLWMRCPWSGESFVRAPPNDFSILTQRADGGFSGGEKLARRPLAPVDS